MSSNRWVQAILLCLLLGVALVLASCAEMGTEASGGTRAWVGAPRDGTEVPPGEVLVLCHAFARAGVAQVELWVNGAFANNAVNTAEPGATYFTGEMGFEASEPGTYSLECRTWDQGGAVGLSERVTVRVSGEIAPPTPVAPGVETAMPTSTGVPPTAVPPPSSVTPLPPTHSPAPTSTPTTPPTPPAIVSFEAVKSDGCFHFTWRVEGDIIGIWFDGEGVGNYPDSRDRCPTATRAYELRAEGPGGTEDTESVTVVVIQPSPTPPPPTPTPDTQGPPAPTLVSPTGNQSVGCANVPLDWNPVSDPSGIGTYYVKVQKITGSPKLGGWTTTDTQYTVSVAWLECGQSYRWAVRAEDGAGNVGPWSAWAEFTVEIT